MALHWSTTRTLFALAGIGVVAGLAGAVVMNHKPVPQPPAFQPATNPYAQGLYANGIVESDLPNGSNINVYPEVAGTVAAIAVQPGQAVRRGDVLLRLEDSVARAQAAQQRAQADAAQAQFEQMQAAPRPEALRVAESQVASASAAAFAQRNAFDKQKRAAEIEPRAVSRDALDAAHDAWQLAQAGLATAQRQLDLVRAGTWSADLRVQAAQRDAQRRAADAAAATLDKYTLRAPADGVVLAIQASAGSYVTPQGVYGTYTQASNHPLLVLGGAPGHLDVRCYVDEILIPRLPPGDRIRAEMSLRGSDARIPLEFVRVEPYVSPKIALTDQRQERVDVRVLPVVFRFDAGKAPRIYPGQLVDVYIGARSGS